MTTTDPFATYEPGLIGPPFNAALVNLATDTTLPTTSRGIAAAGAGVVTVDMWGSGTAIPVPVPAGGIVPCRAKKVYSTANGTTATGVVVFW